MTPKTYARIWLRDNHVAAIRLSRTLGHGDRYVSNLLSDRGTNDATIRGLDEMVHFPADMKAQHLVVAPPKPVVRKRRNVDRGYTKPHAYKWPHYVRLAIKYPSPINWPAP